MGDYVKSVWRYLATQTELTDLLGSDEKFSAWIFQQRLYCQVEASTTSAVVVSPAGQWSGMNDYNTARFPRLRVEVFSDPQRDYAKNVTLDDTWAKINAIFEVLVKLLHVQGELLLDDGVRIHNSKAATEPDISAWTDTDGTRRGTCYFNLSLG